MATTITLLKKKSLAEAQQFLSQMVHYTFSCNGFFDENFSCLKEKVITAKQQGVHDFCNGKGSDVYYTAEDQGSVIGIIAYGAFQDAEIAQALHLKIEEMAEIKCLYVDPAYHGKGLGTELFSTVKNALKDSDYQYWCLYSGHKTSQAFWTHVLGSPKLTLPRFWQEGERSMDNMVWVGEGE